VTIDKLLLSMNTINEGMHEVETASSTC